MDYSRNIKLPINHQRFKKKKEEFVLLVNNVPENSQEVIDPSQSYFWTKKWKKMEKSADRDKYLGNIIGDGTIDGLMDELNT